MEELKEEVDEARKLAEEWEAKYKEMQRQMSLLEEGTPFGKKNSTTGFEKPVLQRGLSTTSSGMLDFQNKKMHKLIMIYKFESLDSTNFFHIHAWEFPVSLFSSFRCRQDNISS